MKRLIALLTVIAACFAAGLQPAFAEDSADGGEKAATRAAAQAKATVKLSVSPSSRTYSASAWTGCSVAVKSNTRWQASSSVSWIKLTRTSGSGNGSVGFKVNANTGSGSRTGRITIRTKGKSVSCTIKQNAKPVTLQTAVSSRNHPASGVKGMSLKVKSNVSWTAKSNVSWIKLTRSSGSGNGSLVYNVTENTGSSARTGTITVSGKGKTAKCKITQAKKTVQLQTAVTSRKHPASGVSGMTLKVTANVPWTATANVSWIRLTRSSGSGNGTLAYNVPENTGSSDRTGKITVSAKGKTATCTITQYKKTKLSISASSRTFTSASASGKLLGVTANVKWTAKSSASWIKLSKTGGNGNGNVQYAVTANSGSTRTGKITVSGGGLSRTFTVTQNGKVTAKANLRFYKPSGWPASIFVTTDKSSTSRRTSFTASSTPLVCVRWAWENNGDATAVAHKARFAISGAGSCVTTVSASSLRPNYYTSSWMYYGKVDSSGNVCAAPTVSGYYTATVTLDSGGDVTEKNESDNTASVSFSVVSQRSAKNVAGGENALSETAVEAPVEAVDGGAPAETVPDDDDWIVVTTSDQVDGSVLLDGDEGTVWGPVGEGGGWVVLSYSEPIDVKAVSVKGEDLPEEGVRVLLSEDADEWVEGTEGRAQYVWVVLPEEAEGATVSEIEVEEE